MKLFFLLSFSTFLFNTLACSQIFNNKLLIPSEKQISNIATIMPRPRGVASLSREIDLSKFLPYPGMQGYKQGSCAAWSVGYGMITYLKQRQERWSVFYPNGELNTFHIYSPAFIYNQLTIDPECKAGIYLTDALQHCQDIGALSVERFAYNPKRCDRKGNISEINEARNVQLLSYNKVFNAFEQPYGRQIDILKVKSQLDDSNVVVIGAHIDKSFIYEYYGNRGTNASRPYIWDRFLDDTKIDTAYHAMLCVGYSNDLHSFKVMNSWDVTFGDHGFIWISENVFEQVVKEAYVAELKPPGSKLKAGIRKESANFQSEYNFSYNFISDVNWIKEGYFRDYGDLRISCLDLNKQRQSAVVRLSNATNNIVITTTYLKVGGDYQVYTFNGREISVKLVKIDKAGSNPFKKGAYFDLKYKNISGENF